MDEAPQIETSRIVLKAVRIEDAADIYAYGRNPNVLRYTTGRTPREFAETEAFVLGLLNKPIGDFVCAIRLRNRSTVIGLIEFGMKDGRSGSIDYALSEDYWNQGIMTEAVRAVLGWAFRNIPGLETVFSSAMTANPASTRVQQKCGMKLQKTVHETWSKFDEPVELAAYSISREEWVTANQTSEVTPDGAPPL